jgi:hypothetical protein
MVSEAWVRLGDYLLARRVELSDSSRRIVFLRQRDAVKFDRIASDLEGHVRDDYDPGTLAKAELVYGWKPGSVRAVLAGGEPTPMEDAPEPSPRSETG